VDDAGSDSGVGLDVPELGRSYITEERQTSWLPTFEGRSRQTGNFNCCLLSNAVFLYYLIFFGYIRRDSVTQILFNLGIPSFNTVVHNSKLSC